MRTINVNRYLAWLLFLIAAFCSGAASAANLRFAFVATGGTVTVNAPTLDAAQEALFVDWLWDNYAPTDPVTGAVLTRNASNEAESFRAWARATWKGTREQVVRRKLEIDRAAVQGPNVPAE